MLDRFFLPNLLGLFLTTCTIAAEDLSYKPCTIFEKKTCGGINIGQGNGFNEIQCKEMCDENERCNFVLSNIRGFCSLFQTCENLKNFKGHLNFQVLPLHDRTRYFSSKCNNFT